MIAGAGYDDYAQSVLQPVSRRSAFLLESSPESSSVYQLFELVLDQYTKALPTRRTIPRIRLNTPSGSSCEKPKIGSTRSATPTMRSDRGRFH